MCQKYVVTKTQNPWEIVTALIEHKHNLVTNMKEIDLICNTYYEENSVLIQIINELQKIKWLREHSIRQDILNTNKSHPDF